MKISVRDLTLSYNGRPAVTGVSLEIDGGEFVAVIGPNGSGKSTLLRGMARLMKPDRGAVLLDGSDVRSISAREVARRLAILPQSPDAGLDLTVAELVWRGRYPHQSLLHRATAADAEAVEWALNAAHVEYLLERTLDSLSGGERQRAWIALALAQRPRVLLLDEPTAFLDVRHQVNVMLLLGRLSAEGMTVVVVLHDPVLAGRYAERVIALREGRVEFDGPSETVLQPRALERVFGVRMMTLDDPETGRPIPLPHPLAGRHDG